MSETKRQREARLCDTLVADVDDLAATLRGFRDELAHQDPPALLPFGLHPPAWVGVFVVLFKMALITFLFIWVRATLPRLRYDQLMSFGWKVLLPLATLNALVTAVLVVVTH